MNKHLALSLFVLLVACQSAPPEEKDSFHQLSKLVDQYAEGAVARGNVNALALAVYRDGEVHENYYGFLDDDQQNLPSDSTLFELASLTKILTGSLAAKAVTNWINCASAISRTTRRPISSSKARWPSSV
ncbi:MAG: serine hydrolase [Bacteroidota bacterium]